jgi:hypothetical protein
MANISIRDLSTTISELLNFELVDLDQQNTIESALDRAISAKDISGGGGVVIIAGGITPSNPKNLI